jgi:hypothetical protein
MLCNVVDHRAALSSCGEVVAKPNQGADIPSVQLSYETRPEVEGFNLPSSSTRFPQQTPLTQITPAGK